MHGMILYFKKGKKDGTVRNYIFWRRGPERTRCARKMHRKKAHWFGEEEEEALKEFKEKTMK
jgi:hypothetical protein